MCCLGVWFCVCRGDVLGVGAVLFAVLHFDANVVPFDWLYLGSVLCDSVCAGDRRSDKCVLAE